MPGRLFPLFFLLLLVFPANSLHAHPHVFIDSRVGIVFDDQGLAGFDVTWVFDEMSSVGYILDFDRNRDDRFDPQELKSLKKNGFDNLKNFHYMTFITIDQRDFEVRYVTDFQAEIDHSRLIYHFFIPCHVRAIETQKAVRFSIHDEEYFVDFTLQPEHIRLRHAETYTVDFHWRKNPDKTIYFGQIRPTEIVLTFSLK